MNEILRGTAFENVVAAVAPCILAPVFEEGLFRGFLLPLLCRRLPVWFSVLVTSLLFGAIHQDTFHLAALTGFGLIMGALYVKSGNLLVSIYVHLLWNVAILMAHQQVL